MEYVYAALMLHSSGKEVSEEGIKAVLSAVGVTPEEVRIKALVSALEGVDIEDVLSKAPTMAAAAAPAAAAAATAAAPVEEEAEEDKEEAEESGIEGLGALFG
ncbi:50S ribosomal protein P1 [Candidatus Methanocrinis natronophilus]|uniref:Large ribosomal subunit protein P1 n=1 Tax=Candidatus Methanocrinis natronophilus TaxID=3033396 RepID=A0ABT5X8H6_9EURY|nr:50S ribosomal protein P1 [Candidatus Methanocrinis natronophilus]MDF0590987.1 50S ribosomal protein P1 [Candidatus Methanocrinis natronophilus]